MFEHSNVVAASILSGGIFLSSALICVFIHSLDTTLRQKPTTGGGGTNVSFPDSLALTSGNSNFNVRVEVEDPIPVGLQQAP